LTLLLSNRPLLEAFRRGDEEAVKQVYRAYVHRVAALLRKGFSFMSGAQTFRFHGYSDEWELECAVQDTFIQAFSEKARVAYDGLAPFGPYLLAIARNRVISLLRGEHRELRRRSRLATEIEAAGPEAERAATTPEDEALRLELRDVVREFRSTLDPELARYFDARYVEERNLLETARHLGTTRMRARLREKKVREKFLEFLEARGHLDGRRPG
jgi:RNA polymerase sigma factor (sigma-70 family)